MARSITGDFLQNFRFHVQARGTTVTPFLNADGSGRATANFNSAKIEGGFQSVTIPELSEDIVEYREGNARWTAKQPGIPTVSDGTLMQGIVKNHTSFFNWALAALEGREYRVDLDIYHYARDEDPLTVDLATVRKYSFENCFASRVKFGPDMDATGSEVSIAEVDFATETPGLNGITI